MLRTNVDKLVKVGVQGKVANSTFRERAFGVDYKGRAFALPSVGGITYNVKVGDPALGWEADHVEPAVSSLLDESNRGSDANAGYHFLACVGNSAVLVSGDAKGYKGVVTGMHGGAEHVMIDFDDETLIDMTVEDKIMIHAYGQGLRLLDYPDIKVYNLAPKVLEKWGIIENDDGTLGVPVTMEIPGMLMGSGVGAVRVSTGDYDIMTQDEKQVRKYGLDKLRLGDFVAIRDHDNTYGRHYREGAITIGIVIHGDSFLSGHGPGVTTLLSCSTALIKPLIDPNANLGQILKIGRFREEEFS